jgi:hypothetical protein
LLTREAFRTWFRHLKPGGRLAVHVTNKFLDLVPVVENLAYEAAKPATTIYNSSDPAARIEMSVWVLVHNIMGQTVPRKRLPVWTDDYSNLLHVLR